MGKNPVSLAKPMEALGMKKVVSILIVAVLLVAMSMSALAAPSSLSAGTRGNASNLITIKKPETSISSTTKKNYGLSAVGSAGTQVAVYKWNGSSYSLSSSGTIGSSGIFVRQLSLNTGTNRLAVWAGKGNSTQVIHLEINVVNQSVVNGINNYKINIQSVLKGWV